MNTLLPRRSLICGLLLLSGCGMSASRQDAWPDAIPTGWSPADALRARVPAGQAGEVLLDDRDGLSPDEAALMALDRNPRLLAERSRRGIARAQVLAAGILPNPRLAASLSRPTTGGEAQVLGYGLGLSWNVTPLLSRQTRVSAAEQAAVAVDLDLAWQEWQVAQGARLHAVRASFLGRREEVAWALEQNRRVQWERLRAALAAGATKAQPVASAAAALSAASLSRLDLTRQRARELLELKQAIGLDALAEPRLDPTWEPGTSLPHTQMLLDQLPARRLDLIALQHAGRSDDLALQAAVIDRFPAVELGVHVGRDVDRVGAAGVSVSIGIPFFDRNQGQVALQRARRVQVEAEQDLRLSQARADVVASARQIELVQQQLAVAGQALRSAADLASRAESTSQRGELTPFAAADLRQAADQARLRQLELEQTLAELQVALAMASGSSWQG